MVGLFAFFAGIALLGILWTLYDFDKRLKRIEDSKWFPKQ